MQACLNTIVQVDNLIDQFNFLAVECRKEGNLSTFHSYTHTDNCWGNCFALWKESSSCSQVGVILLLANPQSTAKV